MKKNIIIVSLVVLLIALLGFKMFFIYKESIALAFMNYDGFEVEGDTIVKYNKTGGNVVIPKIINGVVIMKISSYAFNDLNIDSVVIPDSIVSIGDYAFANNNISRLKIPSSVNYLGEGAFMHNSIVELEMDSEIVIGNACFNDNHLERESAFFLNSNNELISYGGLIRGNVVVDNENITVIGEKAFYDVGIVSITLPDSIIEIKDYAFAKNYLVDVYLPKSLKNISRNTFIDNSYLTNIYVSSEINNILEYPGVSIIEKYK